MTVLALDTEWTDRGDDREVIEVACVVIPTVGDLAGESDRIPRPLPDHAAETWSVERFKPTRRPISFGAMAVHHILPFELEDCRPSGSFQLPGGVEYLVGHNIDADWRSIGAPAGVKRICTDAMARHVWPDADAYSQSALLYMALGPTAETREMLEGAHSAAVDVLNNVHLLEQILRAAPVAIETWGQLYEFSERCRIPRVMPIGEKQGVKGMTLEEAYVTDPGFVEWCLRQDWLDPYLRTGLEQVIEHYHNPQPDDCEGVPF